MNARRLLQPVARRLLGATPSIPSRTTAPAWICPSCAPALRHPGQQRRLHNVPDLDTRNAEEQSEDRLLGALHNEYTDFFKEKGIPGLFSKEGFEIAWTKYQNMILRRLNELTAGDVMEKADPMEIAATYARDPLNASLFNYASMAANNNWFFRQFSTNPQKLDQYSYLKEDLEASFGSIEALKSTMIESAASMFGPGFTWLVYSKSPHDIANSSANATTSFSGFRILNTYLAGTPFEKSGRRLQTADQSMLPANPQGGLPGTPSDLKPLVCVSTWQHTYLHDFGVDGKRNYLEAWWKQIDWSQVDSRYHTHIKPNKNASRSGRSLHRTR